MSKWDEFLIYLFYLGFQIGWVKILIGAVVLLVFGGWLIGRKL